MPWNGNNYNNYNNNGYQQDNGMFGYNHTITGIHVGTWKKCQTW